MMKIQNNLIYNLFKTYDFYTNQWLFITFDPWSDANLVDCGLKNKGSFNSVLSRRN